MSETSETLHSVRLFSCKVLIGRLGAEAWFRPAPREGRLHHHNFRLCTKVERVTRVTTACERKA